MTVHGRLDWNWFKFSCFRRSVGFWALSVLVFSVFLLSLPSQGAGDGDYVMTSLFSVRKPQNWEIRQRTPVQMKIGDPSDEYRFCGVSLEELDGAVDDEEQFLKTLIARLTDEYAEMFTGFVAGLASIGKKGEYLCLDLPFRFSSSGSGTSAHLQVRQWNFIKGPFLVTIMGSSGDSSSGTDEWEFMKSIFDSFSFSSHGSTFLKGYERYRLSDFEGAVLLYRRAIDRNGEIAAYHYNLGLALQAWKGFELISESSAAFAAAASIDNNHIPALNQLAICHGAVGDEGRALEIIEDALERDPGNRESLKNRCKILINMKRGTQALQRAGEYLVIYPEDAEMKDIWNSLTELKNRASNEK
ncbi:MAG: hypothetical protein CVV64_01965 [Candidatus Wallbacteria bacterium HGW-Wallbacteria-1]|jgi:tetratricopeptide (TPR) repeat protein|uniref:Uncharacterized protein n=1 Tax=Candidatus Wallbacteria bacterium HGW-Wallbacteria-1 TaxID=2013854 RepID=A0A2N1PV31_9BACT|nr:MAG: hypothetical protein CVV64_01965 [Candidatus Wallbacteria bacterium HGW-Wallbacteria-1]